MFCIACVEEAITPYVQIFVVKRGYSQAKVREQLAIGLCLQKVVLFEESDY